MKIAGGTTEQGVVVGNVYDKYGSRNPIVRRLMRGFEGALSELVTHAAPVSIHEVGCGEGYWVLHWNRRGLDSRGSDFSVKAIDLARLNAAQEGVGAERFAVRSVYDLEPGRDGADLVVCCEVLEHLERPEEALRRLQRVVSRHLIVSVPREPIWRLLNLARGKYIGSLGNTPGHLQHWSARAFTQLVARYFELVAVRTPLPWTIALCRARA
jgi:2-polyprenyl-3-methyl-5-hydroxy-6-metoxy-1,4-benzoquinol methylase